MPALVKSSFTEALLVVLECTDASFIRRCLGERALALPCSARTRLPA